MEYYINTDGSCKASINKCGSAFIILTKKSYIASSCEAITSCYAFEAELYAVIVALRELDSTVELLPGDKVFIYVDSVKTLRMCIDIIEDNPNEDFKVPMYGAVKELLHYFSRIGVEFEFMKVKAHKDGFNTNKVVDRLSKVAITHFPTKAWV